MILQELMLLPPQSIINALMMNVVSTYVNFL